MKVQYVLSNTEIKAVRDRLHELKQVALMSRDAGDIDANREYYLRAKGFEDCMTILGIIKKDN